VSATLFRPPTWVIIEAGLIKPLPIISRIFCISSVLPPLVPTMMSSIVVYIIEVKIGIEFGIVGACKKVQATVIAQDLIAHFNYLI
jgi:hypothetical protein